MRKNRILLLSSIGLCVVNLALTVTYFVIKSYEPKSEITTPNYTDVTKSKLGQFHLDIISNKSIALYSSTKLSKLNISFEEESIYSFDYILLYSNGVELLAYEYNYIKGVKNDVENTLVKMEEITTTFEQVCGVFEYIEDDSLHSDLNTYTYGGAFDSTKSLEYDHLYLNGIAISFDASSLKDKHLIIQSSNDENIETVVHHYIDF